MERKKNSMDILSEKLAKSNTSRLGQAMKRKPFERKGISSNKSKVKLATVVEGDLEAPFSIATAPKCRRGSWIAPLYPWYVPNIAGCYARRYQVPFLKSLVRHDLGLNPGLPDHWRTLYPSSTKQHHKDQLYSSKNRSYLPNPSARAGYDTRSIFKRSLTGLNSEFSFS